MGISKVIKKKKHSLKKIQNMGLENYILSKINDYADSPAIAQLYKEEPNILKQQRTVS